MNRLKLPPSSYKHCSDLCNRIKIYFSTYKIYFPPSFTFLQHLNRIYHFIFHEVTVDPILYIQKFCAQDSGKIILSEIVFDIGERRSNFNPKISDLNRDFLLKSRFIDVYNSERQIEDNLEALKGISAKNV